MKSYDIAAIVVALDRQIRRFAHRLLGAGLFH